PEQGLQIADSASTGTQIDRVCDTPNWTPKCYEIVPCLGAKALVAIGIAESPNLAQWCPFSTCIPAVSVESNVFIDGE
ncbi:MAG: hypothetical protein ACT6SC_17710, partial [Blastomonas fulva]